METGIGYILFFLYMGMNGASPVHTHAYRRVAANARNFTHSNVVTVTPLR